jgi:UDP-N-acetylmuramoyl-tripeptide--D-alanyl-D-alanine ligase
MSFTTAQLTSYVEGECCGDQTIVCNGAEIDTRRSVQGKVFFALQGTQSDGHDYLDDAVAGGCSAVVIERSCPLDVPVVVVSNARTALFKLAEARRSELPAQQVIAVTGSVGKTTTKDLLAHLLGDNTTASMQSFNNDLGVPLTILDAEDATFLVTEIGANAVGEIKPLATLVQPDIAILTSLGKAHLEGFGSFETVKNEKLVLLKSVHEAGVVILPDTIDINSNEFSAAICTVGTSSTADIQVVTGVNNEGFAELEINGYTVTLSLMGEHNAMNAALAIVATSVALQRTGEDPSMQSLLDAASEVKGATGRLCTFTEGDITVIDDSYNANPTSVRSAIQMFSGMTAQRKVLILGDMLELGDCAHAEHRLLAHVIPQSGADLVILVGSLMEAASSIPSCVHEIDPTDEAIERIVSLIQPHDTVLIKGSRSLQLERIVQSIQRTKVPGT